MNCHLVPPTLNLAMHSALLRVPTTAAIFSHLSAVLAGCVRRAFSSSYSERGVAALILSQQEMSTFCSSVDHGLGESTSKEGGRRGRG